MAAGRASASASPSTRRRRSINLSALGAPDAITIVSGLPRSGTSLLMQMLEAAGLELARDGARGPDADNPRGYHELEAVKRIGADAGFLADCRGRVVKIVAPLVLRIPDAHRFRVVFVERAVDEVLASQRAMLARRGEAGEPGRDEAAIARAFEGALARSRAGLAARPAVPVLFVDHAELIARPAAAVDRIVAFLVQTGAEPVPEARLPEALAALAKTRTAMARVVDPTLHRQRRADAPPRS